jgi:hypothetical protein
MFEHDRRGATPTPRSVQRPKIVCDIKQSNITGVYVTTFCIRHKFAAALNINSASSLTALINRQFELEILMPCDDNL